MLAAASRAESSSSAAAAVAGAAADAAAEQPSLVMSAAGLHQLMLQLAEVLGLGGGSQDASAQGGARYQVITDPDCSRYEARSCTLSVLYPLLYSMIVSVQRRAKKRFF
jgi:hypothetical protein